MVPSRALAAVALVAVCGACTSARKAPIEQLPAASSTAADISAIPSLPPGALVELVPSAAELPPGFAPVEGGAGVLDAAAAAALSDDPDAAALELQRNGFRDGYTEQFENSSTGAFVSVVVLRYAAADGAHADFARAVRESAGAERLALAPLGDEFLALREKVPEGDVQQLVSVRVRVGDIIWLVETGGQGEVDPAVPRGIAERLIRRIA
jgi:hypothetical protein